jgi:hypothetical protein
MRCPLLHGITLLLIFIGAPAFAQDAPTSYELRIYAPGATAPQVTTPIALAAVTCNLEAPAGTVAINPTVAIWNDPANAGKVCQARLDQAGPGPIVALASGPYEGAISGVNAEGAGVESNRGPFARARVPAAVTGLRFTR